MSCQELVNLVNEYLEGALESDDRARFEAHLAECEGCANYLNQMRATINLVGRLTEESVPAPAIDKLMAAFRNWKAT